MPNNSLEAVFHRNIKNILPRQQQGYVMEAFRRSFAAHRPEVIELPIEQVEDVLSLIKANQSHEHVAKCLAIIDEWRTSLARIAEATVNHPGQAEVQRVSESMKLVQVAKESVTCI